MFDMYPTYPTSEWQFAAVRKLGLSGARTQKELVPPNPWLRTNDDASTGNGRRLFSSR